MGKKIKRRFDGNIYPKSAVREGVEAFSRFGMFQIRYLGRGSTEVVLKREGPSSGERLMEEFSNYVLGVAWKRR